MNAWSAHLIAGVQASYDTIKDGMGPLEPLPVFPTPRAVPVNLQTV